MKVRNTFLGGGLAVALVVFGGCGDEGETASSKVGGPAAPTTSIGLAAGTYRVGDVVKFGTAEVTVHSVQDPFDPGKPASQAPAGSRLLALDAEVKNVSKDPQPFSGFAQFQVKDSTDKTFNAVPLPTTFPTLGGETQPGTSRRGLVAFQIPEGSTDLKVVFNNRPSTKGTVTFVLVTP